MDLFLLHGRPIGKKRDVVFSIFVLGNRRLCQGFLVVRTGMSLVCFPVVRSSLLSLTLSFQFLFSPRMNTYDGVVHSTIDKSLPIVADSSHETGAAVPYDIGAILLN